MKKTSIKILVSIYLLFTFISTINVKADELPTGKIGISYQYGEEVFDNRVISIYRVATQDENKQFIYTEDFIGNIEINNLTTSEMSDLAKKLSEQVEEKEIISYQKKITDENGKVEFEDIPYGLYLITVEEVIKDNYEYLSSPMLITLPNYDEVEDKYISEIEITTKTEEIEKEIPTPEPEPEPPVEIPSPNPITGDVIMQYIIVFGISIAAIIILILLILKQKKKGKEEDEKRNEEN